MQTSYNIYRHCSPNHDDCGVLHHLDRVPIFISGTNWSSNEMLVRCKLLNS